MKKIKILNKEYFYSIEQHIDEYRTYETKFYSTEEFESSFLDKIKKFFKFKENKSIKNNKPKYLFSYFDNIESIRYSRTTLREKLEQEFNKYFNEQKRIMEINKGELV